MKKSRAFRHISAWAGILAPILFAILVLIASLLRPGYSQISQNISDLGIGPSAILQNVNFMLFGLLSISFALGLRASLPATRKRAARGVVWLVTVFGEGIMFAGVSLVFVGVLPEQAVMAAHVLARFVAFFTIVAAQLFMWRALEDCERARWYRTYSLVSGLLSLALLFVSIFTSNAAYHGVTERAFLAVPWIWIAVTGIRLNAFIKVQPFSEEAPNTRSFALTRLGSSFRFPQLMTREIALGGVCWLLSLEFFVGQAVAHSAWRTPYSLINNAISDLGSTTCQTIHIGAYHGFVCSPWHVVMNVSFMVTGALILFGFIFTRRAWPRRRLTTWGFAFFALAGLGKIMVGLAPENGNLALHELGSLGIVCGNICVVLLGLAIGRARRWLVSLSLFLGGLGLLGVLLFVGQIVGRGAAERVADYPTIVWMVVLGISFVLWWWADRNRKQLASA